MALEKYRAKRSFNVTAEPRGGKIKRGGDAFVIQKHDLGNSANAFWSCAGR